MQFLIADSSSIRIFHQGVLYIWSCRSVPILQYKGSINSEPGYSSCYIGLGFQLLIGDFFFITYLEFSVGGEFLFRFLWSEVEFLQCFFHEGGNFSWISVLVVISLLAFGLARVQGHVSHRCEGVRTPAPMSPPQGVYIQGCVPPAPNPGHHCIMTSLLFWL